MIDSGQAIGYLTLLEARPALGAQGIVEDNMKFNLHSLLGRSGGSRRRVLDSEIGVEAAGGAGEEETYFQKI